MRPGDPGWPLHRRQRQRRLDLAHAKLDTACADAIAIYREPIMPSRLTEKLQRVAEVHKRMHATLEKAADDFIGIEAGFNNTVKAAFDSRTAEIAARKAEIDGLMKDLAELTNRPPEDGNG